MMDNYSEEIEKSDQAIKRGLVAERDRQSREQLDRLEKKLDWLHWAMVSARRSELLEAGWTEEETNNLNQSHFRPWPGDQP